jgi:hypothetical protein
MAQTVAEIENNRQFRTAQKTAIRPSYFGPKMAMQTSRITETAHDRT